MRVVTPKFLPSDIVNKGYIVVTTDFGSYTTIDQYTYDPTLLPYETSSPGGYENQ
jgi:hypothetical protein